MRSDTDPAGVRVFEDAVRREFAFLKATNRYDELLVKSLPLADGAGHLVPLAELHTQDERLVETLARWRDENSFAYPTRFPVTVEGTARWLRRNVLDAEDRLLFLVLDPTGRPVGHLGYANCLDGSGSAEIDNVVRGEKDAAPGTMTRAMEAVLDWADDVLGPTGIFLRVLDDNPHAIRFYERLGFREETRIPLRRHVDGDSVSFKPLEDGDDTAPDRAFLRMVHRRPSRGIGSEMILTAGPSISAREMAYAYDAARNGWNRQWGAYLKRFEEGFASYLGVGHALATSSGTGALHIAMAALGIGPGDEVIVPDITWVATANAVAYVGATPVFADIEPGSWCLDPASVEARLSDRTKAIIPVHLYGHPARMDRLMEIARAHDLRVVEDAAPALGAQVNGKRAGTFGDFSAFSFQGAKVVVTGEGGMLVTDDDELHERATAIWDQGRVPGTFWINEVGLKYKMANIQAALGLGQLERTDQLVEAKRRLFSWYEAGLADVPHVTLNQEQPWARSIYWMTSILLDEGAPLARDELGAELGKANIDTRPVFPPISRYPMWSSERPENPVARRIGDNAINLPSGVRLRRDEVDYVCNAIAKALGAH